MANKKIDKAISAFSIVALILCFAAMGAAFAKGFSEDLYFHLENSQQLEISSTEDILEAGEAIYNDHLVLTQDIHVSDRAFRIGTSERPFSGTFDGNGYTVYFDYTLGDQDTSLFGCIDEGGVVKNTRFVFGNVAVDGNTFGGIAKINFGTIQDCKIECANITIFNNKGIYSPCVITNKGTIKNIVVDCAFSTANTFEDESSILFGGVCTYNYGTVKNCISAPSFNNIMCADEFKILIGETTNVGIGAACSVVTKGATTTNCILVLPSGVFTSDKNSGLKVVNSYDVIMNADTIFFELDFNNSVWQIMNGELVLAIEG